MTSHYHGQMTSHYHGQTVVFSPETQANEFANLDYNYMT